MQKCVDDGLRGAAKETAKPNLPPGADTRPARKAKSPAEWQGLLMKTAYSLASRKAASCDLDRAPTLVTSTLPFFNSIRVGMPRPPYSRGELGRAHA